MLESENILQVFISESEDLLKEAEDSLIALESSGDNRSALNSVFRAVHTIKGSAQIVGAIQVEKHAHDMESLLAVMRDNNIDVSKEVIDLLFKYRDLLQNLISFVENPHSNVTNNVDIDNDLTKKSKELYDRIVASGLPVSSEPVRATEDLYAKPVERKTIRVDTEKLDTLMNLVGELVTATSNLERISVRSANTDIEEATAGVVRLVDDLRDMSTKLRLLPVKDSFRNFHRMVREIRGARDIDLVINGGDTELDKTVTERILDPLTHIIRNAVDHGIELPDVRENTGKPPKGTILINAFHDVGSIVIEVSDDGRGLDRGRIYEKGIAMGLVRPDDKLTDTALCNLIFTPGFSTAREVTIISGRGVGMDVVKKNIESLGGTIAMESKELVGTKITIRLPLTLAIIDGLMVRIAGGIYVIPIGSVTECIEYSIMDYKKSLIGSCINLHGNMLSFIPLGDYFTSHYKVSGTCNVVIVRARGETAGILVDSIIGETKAVIKKLGQLYKHIEIFSGATVLSDGSVALLLDIPRLLETYKSL